MARYFDGVDDYIVSSNTTSITQYSWTVMVWFRTSVASGKKIIGAENSPGTSGITFWHPHFWVGTDGVLRWGSKDSSGVKIISTPYTVTNNVWRCVTGVCVWNSYIKMYVFDTLIGTLPIEVPSTDALCYWKIGGYILSGWQNGVNGYFPGEIACVKIWRNVELTPDEIKEEMYSIYPRSRLSNLFIFYPLWERDNPPFFLDHSGNYNHGNRYGTTYADAPPMLNRRFVL